MEKVQLNFLMFGKPRCGKSETGNTILNSRGFKTSTSVLSETKEVSLRFTQFNSYSLLVVDTPELQGMDDSMDKRTDIGMMDHAIDMCYGGVDALLYVIKFGNRFTEEDMSVLKTLARIFGNNFMKHVIVVVTFGDWFHAWMKDEDRDVTFDEWCRDQVGALRQLFDECQGRVVLFNNRERDDLKKWAQVQQVIELTQDIRSRVCRYTK